MGLHNLRNHLVLVGDSSLERCVLPFQPAVLGVVFSLEGRRAVLEELLLPLVEQGGMQSMLVAKVGNGHLLDQMPLENPNLLLARKLPPRPCHSHFLPSGHMLTENGEMSNFD